MNLSPVVKSMTESRAVIPHNLTLGFVLPGAWKLGAVLIIDHFLLVALRLATLDFMASTSELAPELFECANARAHRTANRLELMDHRVKKYPQLRCN